MADAVDIFRSIVGLIFKWLIYAAVVVVAVTALIAGCVYGYPPIRIPPPGRFGSG